MNIKTLATSTLLASLLLATSAQSAWENTTGRNIRPDDTTLFNQIHLAVSKSDKVDFQPDNEYLEVDATVDEQIKGEMIRKVEVYIYGEGDFDNIYSRAYWVLCTDATMSCNVQ